MILKTKVLLQSVKPLKFFFIFKYLFFVCLCCQILYCFDFFLFSCLAYCIACFRIYGVILKADSLLLQDMQDPQVQVVIKVGELRLDLKDNRCRLSGVQTTVLPLNKQDTVLTVTLTYIHFIKYFNSYSKVWKFYLSFWYDLLLLRSILGSLAFIHLLKSFASWILISI